MADLALCEVKHAGCRGHLCIDRGSPCLAGISHSRSSSTLPVEDGDDGSRRIQSQNGQVLEWKYDSVAVAVRWTTCDRSLGDATEPDVLDRPVSIDLEHPWRELRIRHIRALEQQLLCGSRSALNARRCTFLLKHAVTRTTIRPSRSRLV